MTQGEALNLFYSVFLLLSLQMAATQDVKGKGEGGDQNFDYMFKLLIIGNSSVGKTSFLFRYADDAFTSAFVSTVGIDFKVKTVYKNDKRIKLQIWVRVSMAVSFCLPNISLHMATPDHKRNPGPRNKQTNNSKGLHVISLP